jgi:hypothetical protein
MAYETRCKASGITCGRIPYFSNPDVQYGGVATGSAAANNALTLNQTAPVVARFRLAGNETTLEETQQVTVFNDGKAELTVTGVSVPGNPAWLQVSPAAFSLPPGGNAQLAAKVLYANAPVGSSNAQIEIVSNDPDENPARLNVSVKRPQEVSSDAPASFNLQSGVLAMAVDVPGMGVLDVTFSRPDPSAWAFQLETYAPQPVPPAGELARFDPASSVLNIPVIEVSDGAGNVFLAEANLQMQPGLQFGVTHAAILEITPSE